MWVPLRLPIVLPAALTDNMPFPQKPHSTSEFLKIGGLVVRMNSDFEWGFFQNKKFSQFSSSSRFHDIQWNFHIGRENRILLHQNTSTSSQAKYNRNDSANEQTSRSTSTGNINGVNVNLPDCVIRIDHADSSCLLDFNTYRADISVIQSKVPSFNRHIISPQFIALFLPGFDAFLFHASALVRKGKTAVFLAPDEGGKTTAVRLSPSGIILGDDQVIVRRINNRFQVYGTPWGLHINAENEFPLSGLFLLQKADQFKLEKLSALELIPEIWREIYAPLSILPKTLKQKAFSLVCDIVDAVPIWKMFFSTSFINWESVDQAMR